jgi:hypothetical protein
VHRAWRPLQQMAGERTLSDGGGMDERTRVAEALVRALAVLRAQEAGSDPFNCIKIVALEANLAAVLQAHEAGRRVIVLGRPAAKKP